MQGREEDAGRRGVRRKEREVSQACQAPHGHSQSYMSPSGTLCICLGPMLPSSEFQGLT